MTTAASRLRRALEAFRREQGLWTLGRLSGEPLGAPSARAFMVSERAIELLSEAVTSGEMGPAEHAAFCAHIGRACLEQRYQPARLLALGLAGRSVSFEGETRRVGDLIGEWTHTRVPAGRAQLARAVDAELSGFSRALMEARASADYDVGELFARLCPPRHADAGPEGGSAPLAERWLTLSEDVAQEALALVRRAAHVEGRAGLDHVWALIAAGSSGPFAREGRFRRLAADWEPLGLRRLLAAHARAAREHPGPWPAPHVLVLSAPRDVRVSSSVFELGLVSELASAEAVGRALGYAHASSALPLALRHAPVASVARAVGTLGALHFAEPNFLRRSRGLSTRESAEVARLAAAYVLIDSRLAAAAQLARPLRGERAPEQAAELAARALLGPVAPGAGAFLVTRLSPGGPLRAKTHALALSWALRERFDEDWFYNPRAAEPLRGALSRAGELSVEGFAAELSVELDRGLNKLAELF